MGISSCSSAKRIEIEAARIHAQVNHETIAAIGNPAVITLNWTEAVNTAKRHNARMVAVRAARDSLRLELAQNWKDGLPRLNLSFSTFDLLKLSVGDWGYALAAHLNLPDYVHYNQAHFVAALTVRRAELILAATERQVLRELYLLFCEDAWLRQEEGTHSLAKELRGQLAGTTLMAQGADTKEAGLMEERRKRWQRSLSEALGNYTAEWLVIAETRPVIPTDIPPPDVAVASGFDELGMRLALIDWEISRLRGLGIRLQQWPSLYPYFVMPNLYDSYAKTMGPARYGGVNIGTDLVWPLTDLWKLSAQKKAAKLEEENIRNLMWQARMKRLRDLEAWRTQLTGLKVKEQALDALTAEIQHMPVPATPEAWKATAEYWLELTMLRLEGERELSALKSMWWICDEQWWARYTET